MFIFPVQLTTSRIDNLTQLIRTLVYVMTKHNVCSYPLCPSVWSITRSIMEVSWEGLNHCWRYQDYVLFIIRRPDLDNAVKKYDNTMLRLAFSCCFYRITRDTTNSSTSTFRTNTNCVTPGEWCPTLIRYYCTLIIN